MSYINGDGCGPGLDRTTEIRIVCNYMLDFRVISVEEASPCKYKMTFGAPISCALFANPDTGQGLLQLHRSAGFLLLSQLNSIVADE